MRQEAKNDPINPDHYKDGGIECIDYLEAKLSPEQFIGFCRGNALKYLSRADKKEGGAKAVQDLEKSIWYSRREVAFRRKV